MCFIILINQWGYILKKSPDEPNTDFFFKCFSPMWSRLYLAKWVDFNILILRSFLWGNQKCLRADEKETSHIFTWAFSHEFKIYCYTFNFIPAYIHKIPAEQRLGLQKHLPQWCFSFSIQVVDFQSAQCSVRKMTADKKHYHPLWYRQSCDGDKQ